MKAIYYPVKNINEPDAESGTNFQRCEAHEAEYFAVYIQHKEGEHYLVRDCDTKREAIELVEGINSAIIVKAEKKNNYGFTYGCHTPESTIHLCEMLKQNGIEFSDESWHNDEIDIVVLKSFGCAISVGDPTHPDCWATHLVSWTEDDGLGDVILNNCSFPRIIEYITSKDFNKAPNLINDLAKEFAKQLLNEIGESNLLRVIVLNSKENSGGNVEQDFCDANECMVKAFQNIMGREIFSNDKDNVIVESAYRIAKDNDFYLDFDCIPTKIS